MDLVHKSSLGLPNFWFNQKIWLNEMIDNIICDHHRCTQVENPGEGVPEVFAKIPWGSRLSGKITKGQRFPALFWEVYCNLIEFCFYYAKCFEICLGVLYLPSPFPSHPPVCMVNFQLIFVLYFLTQHQLCEHFMVVERISKAVYIFI